MNVASHLVPDVLLLRLFHRLLIYWDFQPSQGFYKRLLPTKRKYPVSDSCVEKAALLVSEVRTGRQVRDNRKTLGPTLVTTKVCKIASINTQPAQFSS